MASGAGTLRLAFNGGSLANRSMRSFNMEPAFISAKPGLWSPLTVEAKEERSRVASCALQDGHSVSSGRACTDCVASNVFEHCPHRYSYTGMIEFPFSWQIRSVGEFHTRRNPGKYHTGALDRPTNFVLLYTTK